MLERIWLIFFFAGLLVLLWRAVSKTTPHRGLHAGLEALCLGAILCLGLSLVGKPFGVEFPNGPLPSLFAAAMGLPGAILAFFVGCGL